MRKWLILGLTLAWLAWELPAAFDNNADTYPLTQLIVEYVPPWITIPAAAILAVWLPLHFIGNYRRKSLHRRTVMPEAPDPNTSSSEPLVSRAAVVAVFTILVDLGVKFGLKIDEDTKTLVIGLVSTLAPIGLAWWARRHVYAPASVATLIAAARRDR